MVLTTKQSQGLDIAIERFLNGEKYTVIAGYAGVGKSTLVRFIIEALVGEGYLNEDEVGYATYTGKAALVLKEKGNQNVSTLDKLLYNHIPKEDGRFIRTKKIELPYKLVVVDEVSMAPDAYMKLLFNHNVHVLCLGDPFQLPPIDKKTDNHLLDNPHIFLDEVMRQATDSEIIRLSMLIRDGKDIPFVKGEEVFTIPKRELSIGMLKWADQNLCATNRTRMYLNSQIRQFDGRNPLEPENGDKVICLRNYWDVESNTGEPLVNGSIGYLNNIQTRRVHLPQFLTGKSFDSLVGNVELEIGDTYEKVRLDKNQIITGNPTLDYKTLYKLQMNKKYKHMMPLDFAYGYVITGHKSQGSEWDKVLVYEEDFPFDKEEHARWLYTCCTRASKKLVLVR